MALALGKGVDSLHYECCANLLSKELSHFCLLISIKYGPP